MALLRSSAVLLALATVSLYGKPNLTGEWKLNAGKSEFGQWPAPSSMVQKVSHEDPKLKVAVKSVSDMGEFEWEAAYTTDGKPSNNEFRGNPSTSLVTWQGDSLVFDTKAKFQDNEMTINDKWTLSEDGKTLTINRKFASSMGELQQKLILEKQ